VCVAVMQAPKHRVHSKTDPTHHIVLVRLSHRDIARGELPPSQAEIRRRTRLVQKKATKDRLIHYNMSTGGKIRIHQHEKRARLLLLLLSLVLILPRRGNETGHGRPGEREMHHRRREVLLQRQAE
jgi:hypothetical protein